MSARKILLSLFLLTLVETSNMRLRAFAALMLPLAGNAVNVVMSNDDGWVSHSAAEINIRQFYDSLTHAGFSAIISAPAENQSGRGSSDAAPTPVGSNGCELHSCPAGSPPVGKNASMPNFNYVNSYPVTSMRFGIQNLSTTHFGGPPDIAVAGPNVGANLGLTTFFSGTVGAATETSKIGVPGLAFSGTTGSQTAWNTPIQLYETVYADLSTTVTQALTSSGKPYLPDHTWLNVNFPAVSSTQCSSISDIKFVLSRIHTAVHFFTPHDVVTCGNGGRLPTETRVVATDGCYASISVGHAPSKLDASSEQQAEVLKKLSTILSCLP